MYMILLLILSSIYTSRAGGGDEDAQPDADGGADLPHDHDFPTKLVVKINPWLTLRYIYYFEASMLYFRCFILLSCEARFCARACACACVWVCMCVRASV